MLVKCTASSLDQIFSLTASVLPLQKQTTLCLYSFANWNISNIPPDTVEYIMEQPKDTSDVKEFKGNAITPEGTTLSAKQSPHSAVADTITVTWAQRSSSSDAERNHIFLTIVVPDVEPKNMKLDIQPAKLTFTGYSDSRKASYHVEVDFYAEIDPSATKTNHTGRALEFVLQKKDLSEEFWPRLFKDAKKVHWLKTDFDKVWQDNKIQLDPGRLTD